MERFVNTFGRNTDRTSPRAGFRVIAAQSDSSQDEPTAAVETQPIEDTLVDESIKVEQLVEAAEPEVVEEPQADLEPKKPQNPFEMFINSLPKPAIDEEIVSEPEVTEPIELIPIPPQAESVMDQLDAAKRTIEVLSQAIAEKDEYISKLKEYAQVSDDELKLAREQNKTLLEVTGKFVMRF